MPFAGRSLQEAWQTDLAQPNGIGELIQLTSGEHIRSISRWVLAAGRGAIQSSALGALHPELRCSSFIKMARGWSRNSTVWAQAPAACTAGRRFSRVVPATVSSTVTGMTLIAVGEDYRLESPTKIAGVPFGVFARCVDADSWRSCRVARRLRLPSVSALPRRGRRECARGCVVVRLGLASELFIVDKTLRPKLVGEVPIRLPFLPTFLDLIGGVKTMALSACFVGPCSWR